MCSTLEVLLQKCVEESGNCNRAQVLTPIFNRGFSRFSYGFRRTVTPVKARYVLPTHV